MRTLLAAVLVLAAARAGAAGSVRVETASPDGVPLRDAVVRRLSLAEDAPQVVSAGEADASFRVAVARGKDGTVVETRMGRTGAPERTLRSVVASESPAAAAAAAAADVLWLWRSAAGRTAPSAPPPELTAALSLDTLPALWSYEPIGEPMGIAASGGPPGGDRGFLLCLSDRVLALGPLFRVIPETMRDVVAVPERGFPGLLAAAAETGDGCIAALDAEAARIDILDPVTGRRLSAVLPPAAPGGGRIAGLSDGAAVLRQGALCLARRVPEGIRVDEVPLPASALCSAAAADAEGRVWAYDASERRVRILSERGVEVGSIRPLLARSPMDLPQEMAVFPDGSFLLAGSGEIRKFDATGGPLWTLARLPGPLGEALPASMGLAASADGCFYVLDGTGGRILRFSDSSDRVADGDPLPMLRYLYGNADPRDARGAERIGDVARMAGLTLLALQFADSMSEAARESVRRTLVLDMASAARESGDALERGLLPGRAQPLLERSLELYRAARERDPTDPAPAPAIEALLAARKAVRDAQRGGQELEGTASVLAVGPRREGYASWASLRLTIRNAGEDSLRGIEAAACVPGRPERGTGSGSLAVLAPAASSTLEVTLPLSGPVDSLALLVSWDSAGGKRRLALSVALAPAQAAGRTDPVEELRTLSAELDPAVTGLLAPLRKAIPDPLECAATALEWIGSLRTPPPAGSWQAREPRLTLRDLAATDRDWLVLAGSVLSALGIPFGWVEGAGNPVLLLRTDAPLEQADRLCGGDGAAAALLRTLSAGGTLCIPYASADASIAASVAEGCRALAAAGPVLAVRWADPAAADPAAPSAAPILPGTQTRADRAMLARAIAEAMAGRDRR